MRLLIFELAGLLGELRRRGIILSASRRIATAAEITAVFSWLVWSFSLLHPGGDRAENSDFVDFSQVLNVVVVLRFKAAFPSFFAYFVKWLIRELERFDYGCG